MYFAYKVVFKLKELNLKKYYHWKGQTIEQQQSIFNLFSKIFNDSMHIKMD